MKNSLHIASLSFLILCCAQVAKADNLGASITFKEMILQQQTEADYFDLLKLAALNIRDAEKIDATPEIHVAAKEIENFQTTIIADALGALKEAEKLSPRNETQAAIKSIETAQEEYIKSALASLEEAYKRNPREETKATIATIKSSFVKVIQTTAANMTDSNQYNKPSAASVAVVDQTKKKKDNEEGFSSGLFFSILLIGLAIIAFVKFISAKSKSEMPAPSVWTCQAPPPVDTDEITLKAYRQALQELKEASIDLSLSNEEILKLREKAQSLWEALINTK